MLCRILRDSQYAAQSSAVYRAVLRRKRKQPISRLAAVLRTNANRLAGAMRQASQYHIIFVFRPGPCDLPRERQFLQQSTEPDHKSDFLCSQQRPQRLRCSQQDCFRARLRRSRLFKILQQHRIDIHSHAPGTPLLEQIVQPDPRRHQCKEPAVGQV